MTEATKSNRNEKKVTRSDLNKAFFRWVFFRQSAQNFERLMALAFCHTMAPILKKLYGGDKEEYIKSLQRHMQFFNTEPQLGCIIPGITIALEEAKANGKPISEDLITSTKNALMGPFAGLGDSIIVGTYIPILLSIALGMSGDGSPIGAIFYAVVYIGTILPLSYYLFMQGYELGLGAAKSFLSETLTAKVTQALRVLGLIVIGGVSAQFTKAPVAFVYKAGEMEVSLQKILDSIMPKLLPLLIILGVWYLMDKRKWGIGKIFLALIIMVVVFTLLGIF